MSRSALIGRVRSTASYALVCGLVVLVGLVATAAPRLLRHETPIGPSAAASGGPGALVSADLDTGLTTRVRTTQGQTAKIQYRSTDSDGRATTVSGIVFRPTGPAPKGGWPVIALAHGNTGVLKECGPSLSPLLAGALPTVIGLVAVGYAVAVTDYQGLGVTTEGHPFLDNQTEARNVIDSVRALRALWPKISPRWAAMGFSQGGGPAWAANELASAYAPELSLAGTASMSPPADMSGLVAKAAAGTMTSEQVPAMQALLLGLSLTMDGFPLDQFRDQIATDHWEALSQCLPGFAAYRNAAVDLLTPTSFAPHSAAAADLLTRRLERMSTAQRPLSAPMLVVYGGRDELVDPSWTEAAIERQRLLGGDLTVDRQEDASHAGIDLSAMYPFLQGLLPPGRATTSGAKTLGATATRAAEKLLAAS